MNAGFTTWMMTMPFPDRLAALRKQQGFTQQSLADAIQINVSQLKRYEAGTSQPTLEVLRKLAVALTVSADVLLFDKDERGPDDELRLQFEAVSRMSPEDKLAIKTLLEGMIVKNRAKQMLEGIGG
jgi:transcriptional regulator with XRE-family HTH domain